MLLFVTLHYPNLIIDAIPCDGDVPTSHRVLCLVNETLHEVLLALPAVGCCMLEINVGEQLDHCITALLYNQIKRLVLP